MEELNLNNINKPSEDGTAEMPVVALRGLVIMPNVTIHFDVSRKRSLEALTEAIQSDQRFFAVSQKSIKVEDPSFEDLYKVGTVVRIKQVVRMPNDIARVLVEGICRGRLLEITETEPCFMGEVELLQENHKADKNAEALSRIMLNLFDRYSELKPRLTQSTLAGFKEITDINKLSDIVASNMMLKNHEHQELLECFDPVTRLEKIVMHLTNEIEILNLENSIGEKVKVSIDKHQREYYLKEQMQIIRTELGEESFEEEKDAYKNKIEAAGMPDYAKEKCEKELKRLSKMNDGSSEANVIRTYLDTVLELPWNSASEEQINLKYAAKVLDRDHYGLEKVKERILENLAVSKLNPDSDSNILCLVGPPGVGKTSIAKSLATATGRNYVRISLGGMRDEADIRGHRRTYIGSMPGRIINAVKTAGSKNPLILLDEIDKMGNDFKGDPASAMLEVLDSAQNSGFVDHYIDMPFDLSHVMFITTANKLDTIPRPLLDRMEVIELTGYTEEEKIQIAKKYLIPKQKANAGVSELKIDDRTIRSIISGYTRESGVRNLERTIGMLCRKRAKEIVEKQEFSPKILSGDIHRYLGSKKYFYDRISLRNEIGVVTGLAWTQAGGDTLQIEVNIVDGTGKVELTGSLGDIMKESAMAAISYTRSIAKDLKLPVDFYKKKDVHVHVPDGATPKDGPSAGITIAAAIISAFTGAPVKREIAMTGEITLRGRVLPIGGLKEKALAAVRAGVSTIIIPFDNMKDIETMPDTVKNAITFKPVKHMDEVLKMALCAKSEAILQNIDTSDAEIADISEKFSENTILQ